MCTDMGTEMQMVDFQGVRLQEILPDWMCDRELQSEDACPDTDTQDTFLFENALLCPGLLHICHNMTLEIDRSLAWWKEWLPPFKALSHLLHCDHLRRRLIAFCVKNTSFDWLEESFKVGVPKPAEWRWGNISKILPSILARKKALQAV